MISSLRSGQTQAVDKKKRFTVVFVIVCIALAVAVCLATTAAMLFVIWWYISNCGNSPACSSADWLISYWWALFVPGCLIATFLLRKLYERRYALIEPEVET